MRKALDGDEVKFRGSWAWSCYVSWRSYCMASNDSDRLMRPNGPVFRVHQSRFRCRFRWSIFNVGNARCIYNPSVKPLDVRNIASYSVNTALFTMREKAIQSLLRDSCELCKCRRDKSYGAVIESIVMDRCLFKGTFWPDQYYSSFDCRLERRLIPSCLLQDTGPSQSYWSPCQRGSSAQTLPLQIWTYHQRRARHSQQTFFRAICLCPLPSGGQGYQSGP